MNKPVFCTLGPEKALLFAKNRLTGWGYRVQSQLDSSVTHLLLPVPTPPEAIPQVLPPALTVLGGRLPVLPCRCVDLLQDEHYLQENAAITAECAVQLAQERIAPAHLPVLVIGWGRIGKCLASRLRLLGSEVTVAARAGEARKQLAHLGFPAVDPAQLSPQAYRLIFNTAPAPVLDATGCKALCIDLASVQGISGGDVLWARGLPGKMAPEASGALIAKTALRYALGKE